MRWYVLDVNPEPWAIGPVSVIRRGGKLVPVVGRNAQLFAYQEAVKAELDNPEMLEGKFKVRFYFWRNRADYTTPQARTHRKHEADVTNLQKATEDALQGVLFKNDKDVVDIHSTMVEQGPDVMGRIVVGIETVEYELADTVDLPQAVWDYMHTLDTPAKESSNVWPPPGGTPY